MSMLNLDNDMLERMETSLSSHAGAAITQSGVQASVFGVFSLDELEEKTIDDLCGKVALGVAYAGAEPPDSKPSMTSGPGGDTVKIVDYVFHVILAVPIGKNCLERYSATKLLTILRRGINGKFCDGDAANRTWQFVKEFPNVEASTADAIFYSQVWKIRIPLVP